MNKTQLIDHLDQLLKTNAFIDQSKNWLQIDTIKNDITKIWYAVDANNYIFDIAIYENIDLLIVHHWLFWWEENLINWIFFNKISKLIKNNIWLYASHLPLDVHPSVWNNQGLINQLIKDLNIKNYTKQDFWEYKWNIIWAGIIFEENIEILRICDLITSKYWFDDKLYNFWNKEYINSLCIVSWWADLSQIIEAKNYNYDILITWELPHHTIVYAKEISQTIFLGWHRETETTWVKLLSEYLEKELWLQTIFLDKKY